MEVGRLSAAVCPMLLFMAKAVKGNWSSLLVDIFSNGGLSMHYAMCFFHLWLH